MNPPPYSTRRTRSRRRRARRRGRLSFGVELGLVAFGMAPWGADSAPEERRENGTSAAFEETCVQMTETIDAIKERLGPPHLIEKATESIKEAIVSKAAQTLGGVVDRAKQIADRIERRVWLLPRLSNVLKRDPQFWARVSNRSCPTTPSRRRRFIESIGRTCADEAELVASDR
jgi:hypothetical protein